MEVCKLNTPITILNHCHKPLKQTVHSKIPQMQHFINEKKFHKLYMKRGDTK